MKLKYLIILLVLFMPLNVSASDTGIVTASDILYMRTSPTTDSARVKCLDGTDVELKTGSTVTIFETVDSLGGGDTCGAKKWYKIKGTDWYDKKEYEGYACASLVKIKEPTIPVPQESIIPEKYDVIGYASYPGEGRVPIIVPKEGTENTCTKKLIVIDNKLNCVDENKLSNIVEVSVLDTANIPYNYEEELAKFPKSYQDMLKEIHTLHPNWRFYAYDTGLDFNDAVSKEKKRGLIQSSVRSDSYFDTLEKANYDWVKNEFKYHEANVWVTPSTEATAYFLDPRTYLNKNLDLFDGVKDYKDIFVFEDARAYTYQKDEVLNQMIIYGGIDRTFEIEDGTSKTFKESFTIASSFSKISPLILVSRSRNETATFTSGSVTGTFVNDNGLDLSGYYNFFNVGAYGDLPITNGLIYAKDAGWTNPYRSIAEGSTFIGTKYIYNGQETQYFQKFNVSPYTLTPKYDHQFQTNIEAPKTEASFVFWGYYDSGNIDQPIVFHIPVYRNMPDKPSPKPLNGSPNNWLKSITINGTKVCNSNDTFDGDKYYSYNNNWDDKEDMVYNQNVILYTVDWNVDNINVLATPILNTAKVLNGGNIALKDKTTTIDLKVEAENKTTKTYRIVVTKKDRPAVDETGEIVYPDIKEVINKTSVKYDSLYMKGLSKETSHESFINTVTKLNNSIKVTIKKNRNNTTSNFATGDVITFDNGKDKLEFTYVLFGDMNGDNNINLVDLVHVRNIILEQSNLKGAYKAAGDINHDGKIDLADLIFVRNDILGTPIEQ